MRPGSFWPVPCHSISVSPPDESGDAMQIELTEQTLTWQQLVLDYVERELIP